MEQFIIMLKFPEKPFTLSMTSIDLWDNWLFQLWGPSQGNTSCKISLKKEMKWPCNWENSSLNKFTNGEFKLQTFWLRILFCQRTLKTALLLWQRKRDWLNQKFWTLKQRWSQQSWWGKRQIFWAEKQLCRSVTWRHWRELHQTTAWRWYFWPRTIDIIIQWFN